MDWPLILLQVLEAVILASLDQANMDVNEPEDQIKVWKGEANVAMQSGYKRISEMNKSWAKLGE
jgi:hypothetical protein